MHFDVKISPNPTVKDFRVQILTTVAEKATVKIMGSTGRFIKEMILSPYQKNLSIGSELGAGTYIVEITQGENSKTETLEKY